MTTIITAIAGFIPNIFRSAGGAAIKAGAGEFIKNLDISTTASGNKKMLLTAFVTAVVALLNHWGIEVAKEWTEVVIAGLLVYAAMFAVSKPKGG